MLDGSEQAFLFYRSLGAVPMGEWTGYWLSGEAPAALASLSDGMEQALSFYPSLGARLRTWGPASEPSGPTPAA